MPYVANTSTKQVHKKPTIEQCNVDDARKAGHARDIDSTDQFLDLLRTGYTRCKHCLPDPGEPPEAVW